MDLQDTLLSYSEWLDGQALMPILDEDDNRTHDELVSEFIEHWESNPDRSPLIGQESKRQSNMVDHAKRELRILGYTGEEPKDDPDRWMYDNIMKMVGVFAEEGHSGSSAAYATHVLEKVLRFENLTPINNNPEDWIEVGEGTWQCRRNSRLFSNDGGKTYSDLNEYRRGWRRKLFGLAPTHTSKEHKA